MFFEDKREVTRERQEWGNGLSVKKMLEESGEDRKTSCRDEGEE